MYLIQSLAILCMLFVHILLGVVQYTILVWSYLHLLQSFRFVDSLDCTFQGLYMDCPELLPANSSV
jgi:hypothetical protein